MTAYVAAILLIRDSSVQLAIKKPIKKMKATLKTLAKSRQV